MTSDVIATGSILILFKHIVLSSILVNNRVIVIENRQKNFQLQLQLFTFKNFQLQLQLFTFKNFQLQLQQNRVINYKFVNYNYNFSKPDPGHVVASDGFRGGDASPPTSLKLTISAEKSVSISKNQSPFRGASPPPA